MQLARGGTVYRISARRSGKDHAEGMGLPPASHSTATEISSLVTAREPSSRGAGEGIARAGL